MAQSGAWTLLGPRHGRVRPSYTALVLAMLFAWPVMVAVPSTYPAYMTVLALGTGTWFAMLAFRARVIVGLLFIPVALLWLHPMFGAEWFTHEGPAFFLIHSAMALLLGVAGYTYAATERA